ncbi:MAG: hypothetical protein HOW73_44850 [Polyangiaceae bacterium]|nr:hypothetical protein [Polyangiaceae bacterium]
MVRPSALITFTIALSIGCGDSGSGGSDSGGGSAGGSNAGAGGGGGATGGSDSNTVGGSGGDADGGNGVGGFPMAACDSGPLAAPIPGCAPAPYPSSGDINKDCFDRINQLRWECQCLPPLERWTKSETCVDEQAGNDEASGAAHANFGDCGEFGQNSCPGYGSPEAVIGTCLQQMWDEGPGDDFETHGHYINMTNPDYSKVACGFSEDGTWSNQDFQ